MKIQKVILISGMSGAGKTTAMGILEDLGYRCIDQLPSNLLPSLMEDISNSKDARYAYLALSTYLLDFDAFNTYLKGLNLDLSVILLDSSSDQILKRYKFTRRMHPMLLSNTSSSLEEGIAAERDLFSKAADQNITFIDTTNINATELKQRLNQLVDTNRKSSFSISFISFGYKNGVPLDADLLFDVRFLPNPHWDESLRPYNGNDEVIYRYVMESKESLMFVRKLQDFLDYAFVEYAKEGKNHFTVGIGCTGGKHRSVAIVNYLCEVYSKDYQVYKDHRDLE